MNEMMIQVTLGRGERWEGCVLCDRLILASPRVNFTLDQWHRIEKGRGREGEV